MHSKVLPYYVRKLLHLIVGFGLCFPHYFLHRDVCIEIQYLFCYCIRYRILYMNMIYYDIYTHHTSAVRFYTRFSFGVKDTGRCDTLHSRKDQHKLKKTPVSEFVEEAKLEVSALRIACFLSLCFIRNMTGRGLRGPVRLPLR
jgi:hypothetical protein